MSVKRSSRVRNPQGQGSRLRAELIDAADRLLARTGDVPGLSLRAVAREVGIATPSIYLHFPDKEALVHAVLAARFAQLGEAVRAAVSRATGPAEQLRAGCLAYCRFAVEHPNAYRVLFPGTRPQRTEGQESAADAVPESSGSAAEPDAPARERSVSGLPPDGLPPDDPGARTFGVLVDGIRACMDAGAAPAGDPFRTATNVWAALHGAVSLRSSAPGFPWQPLERQVDDVLAGLVGLHHNPPSAKG